MKLRMTCFFISSLLVVAAIGTMTVSSAQERQMGGVGITVFFDQNFRGKSSTFRQDVPNLDPLGFNDKVSSLRVGRGEQWEVCEHANYQGRCVVVSGAESDLRRNAWNDIISSLRRVGGGVPPAPPPQLDPYIVLYDQTIYRGNPTNYNRPVSDLYGFNRRAQSVTIGRGVWELCEGRNFTGRCVTLERSVPDLRAYNLRKRVSSVRPIGSGGSIPPPPPSDWYIVLYDQTTYRGNPTNYTGAESNINQRARSVTIGRGVWELCENPNFNGRCLTLDKSVPNLPHFLRNRVSSLRPVRRQPRGMVLAQQPPSAGSGNEANALFGKRWTLTEMEGRKLSAAEPYLEFDRDQKRASGSGGCNRFTGAFEVDGSMLKLSRVASTKRACLDVEVQRVETSFLRLLETTTSFEVQGNTLHLYATRALVLVFQ